MIEENLKILFLQQQNINWMVPTFLLEFCLLNEIKLIFFCLIQIYWFELIFNQKLQSYVKEKVIIIGSVTTKFLLHFIIFLVIAFEL